MKLSFLQWLMQPSKRAREERAAILKKAAHQITALGKRGVAVSEVSPILKKYNAKALHELQDKPEELKAFAAELQIVYFKWYPPSPWAGKRFA